MTVADTHAPIWAPLGDKRLSPAARAVMTVSASDQIGILAISLVEIAYLEEKGRVPIGMLARTVAILAATTSVLAEIPMTRIPRDAIADMPDRIIAATALHLQVPLISRDATIQAWSVRKRSVICALVRGRHDGVSVRAPCVRRRTSYPHVRITLAPIYRLALETVTGVVTT